MPRYISCKLPVSYPRHSSYRGLIFQVILFVIFSLPLYSQVKHPEWSYNLNIYEVNVRQFTEEGTFKSFEKHLPRLKELGVGILWFMPITPIGELNRKGTLGSYYSVKDYYGVNPEFGTMEDFKHLVKKIHEMGMYVIVDWVANHTSWDNNLIKEHPEWFMKNDEGEFIPPVADWTDVIDLNYDVPELWQYMKDAMKFWITETNIDGFRCDVAGMIPIEFWNEVRAELDKLKPVFMLAEAEGPEFHEKAFDATYSWDFFKLMNLSAKGEKKAADFIAYFKKEEEAYPTSAFRMRFTSNHDENTWNGTAIERLGDAAGMFAALTNVVTGIPLIYSGQEAGLNKRLKFFERDPIEWQNHPYNEIYQKLFHLRKENEALYSGEKGGEQLFIQTENSNILAFIRRVNQNNILSVFNLSNEPVSVILEHNDLIGDYINLFQDQNLTFSSQPVTLSLKPWDFQIFVKK